MITSGLAERRAQELWSTFKTRPIIAQALRALEAGTPPSRYPYHNVDHAKDVAIEALALAIYDCRGERELDLVALAAVYHDIGFLFRYEKNEAFAAVLVAEAMRDYGGYDNTELETVKAMIMATVIRPHPRGGIMQSVLGGILSGYIADADLGNFGNATFFAQSENVWNELLLHGKIPNDTLEARAAFKRSSLVMLKNHTYYTDAARVLRSPQKHMNILQLETDIK